MEDAQTTVKTVFGEVFFNGFRLSNSVMQLDSERVDADVSRACGLLLWQIGMLTGKRHRITVVEIDP